MVLDREGARRRTTRPGALRNGSTSNELIENVANHNGGNGISVTGVTSGNTFVGKTVRQNGFTGIFAARSTFGNTFTENTACHNAKIMFEGDAVDFGQHLVRQRLLRPAHLAVTP